MTKLLLCVDCMDIISPHRRNNILRKCYCERHTMWWMNGRMGQLGVHDAKGHNGVPLEVDKGCWIIGIDNNFLGSPIPLDAAVIAAIIDKCPDNYLFKKWNSCIVRFRVGETNDVTYGTLPRV